MQTSKSAKLASKNLTIQTPHYVQTVLKYDEQPRAINYMEQTYSQSELNSQDEPQFQTKNYVFELQSKYHNLQYQKTKNHIEYHNQISQLKNQNMYLQSCASNISQDLQTAIQQREQLRYVLGEVREQNYGLSKQIYKLRQQLYGLQSRSVKLQLQPDLKLLQQLQQRRQEIIQKERIIKQLTSSLESCKFQTNNQINLQKLYKLQKQKQKLQQKLRVSIMQQKNLKQQLQIEKVYKLQKQNIILKLSQKQQKYEQQIFKHSLQIQKIRQQNQLKIKKIMLIHNEQIKHLKHQKLNENSQQNNILLIKNNELNIQINKLKSNKTNLQQYIKYLQQNYNKDELKNKKLQQDIFLLQKQNQQLKVQLFNEKINYNKIINDFKLQYQQQKIKYSQIIQEQNKQVNKFKQINSSTNRKDIQFQQLNQKYNRNIQQLLNYNKQNDQLKIQLKKLRQKYQNKKDKYSLLQKQLRKQYEGRIKQLETQIYKAQISHAQYQLQLQKDEKVKIVNNKEQMIGFNNDDDEQIQLNQLHIQKIIKQQCQQIQQLKTKLLQSQQLCRSRQQKIARLQVQLKQLRQAHYRVNNLKQDKNNKIQVISQLQQQNMRLNKQIKKQRSNNDQLRKLMNQYEQKIKIYQEQIKQQARNFQIQYNQLNYQYIQSTKKCQHLCDLIKQIQNKGHQKYQENQNNSQIIKQMQEIFNKENKTLITRIQTLQKTIINLKQQIEDENVSKRSISSSGLSKIQKQNYQLKIDYSQSLQEINNLLIKYQKLQEKYKKLTITLQNNMAVYNNRDTGHQSKKQRQMKELIAANQDQINKLNIILMEKQKQIKALKNHNNSHKNQHNRNINTQLWLAKTRIPNQSGNYKYPSQQLYQSSLFYKK